MNIPIYIKGSGDTFDITKSEHILNDRQLFYHKQTHQLYIGDGSTKLKDLKPIYSDIIDSIDDKAPNLEAVDSYYSYDANGEPVAVKKPKSITFTINAWGEVADSNFYPYQGSANVTLDNSLKRIELINNNAELFAQYGFAITALNTDTSTIVIGAVENPNTEITFTCILHYDI